MDGIMWTDFLTGFFGVVLGIILTFGVNFLWRRREEKKRTKDMLILVRNELVTNKEGFKLQEEFIKKDSIVYQKILEAKDDLSSIPADVLKDYHLQIQSINVGPLKTTAWQIFQNSEMIQKMTDKEMVIRLTDCYALMVTWQEFIMKDYWEIKKRMMVQELYDPLKFFSEVLINNEMHNFCETFRLDKEDIWQAFFTTDTMIDYTIELLDKHGDYRYDMEENDNEIIKYFEEKTAQKANVAKEDAGQEGREL
jgi:hypothetical protein